MHSATRAGLFGKERATHTGLTQTAWIFPYASQPRTASNSVTFVIVFADGAHVVAYTISNTHTAWGFTTREVESRETRRAIEKEPRDVFLAGMRRTRTGRIP